MLAAQCNTWGGPVSASIWLPLPIFSEDNAQALANAISTLQTLHDKLEAQGERISDSNMQRTGVRSRLNYMRLVAIHHPHSGPMRCVRSTRWVRTHDVCPAGTCTLDMVLLSELMVPTAMWAYPYNSLRNQAIARTKTKVSIVSCAVLAIRCLRSAVLATRNSLKKTLYPCRTINQPIETPCATCCVLRCTRRRGGSG